MTRTPPVIIIGGGFSGATVAVQLARRDIPSLLVDPGEDPARGIAYSTNASHHLLNVRASNMSAFPHLPNDFASFIGSRGARPDSFARRSEFGDYLASAVRRAMEDGFVTHVRRRAIGACPISNGWSVTLEGGDTFSGKTLVLATGNAPPAPLTLGQTVQKADLIDMFWTPAASSRLARAAAEDEPVLIVGTGLTMVDALLSLDAAGHRGPLIATSRRGLLPLAHAAPAAAALPRPQLVDVPLSLSGMIRWIRRRALAETDWQQAIDALRPITQAIWGRMDQQTRERFLRHGRPFWDVHRHRVAPDLHHRVYELRKEGRLTLIAGRLKDAHRKGRNYSVTIAPRGGAGGDVQVDAGLIINCTGPLASLRRNPDPLISRLIMQGIIRPDSLDLGAQVDDTGRLEGVANAYAIGPITRGRWWEITAVPDLRVKAEEIAASISMALSAGHVEAV